MERCSQVAVTPGTIHLWDAQTGARNFFTFTGAYRNRVSALAFSPDGKTLVSGDVRVANSVFGTQQTSTKGRANILDAACNSEQVAIFAGWKNPCQWKRKGNDTTVGCPHKQTFVHSYRSYKADTSDAILFRWKNARKRKQRRHNPPLGLGKTQIAISKEVFLPTTMVDLDALKRRG